MFLFKKKKKDLSLSLSLSQRKKAQRKKSKSFFSQMINSNEERERKGEIDGEKERYFDYLKLNYCFLHVFPSLVQVDPWLQIRFLLFTSLISILFFFSYFSSTMQLISNDFGQSIHCFWIPIFKTVNLLNIKSIYILDHGNMLEYRQYFCFHKTIHLICRFGSWTFRLTIWTLKQLERHVQKHDKIT